MIILIKRIYTSQLNFSFDNEKKLLITTVNAHTFNLCRVDEIFLEALLKSDILLPDGVGTIFAGRLLSGLKLKKISGFDLFIHEMEKLNLLGGRCFFLGSTDYVLGKIKDRAGFEYPNVIIDSYSPPFKPAFSYEENLSMINSVNNFYPDVLFIGMTQPKQEKWASEHISDLQAIHICCIGAVFDFYAGTISRAPTWMINLGIEWLYRLIREPRRMWRRYLIGNVKFFFLVLKDKIYSTS